MAGIPQVITEDRASGAQVVEGSLKFDVGNYNRLQRTQVGGNRKTFTWSGWIKNTDTFVNNSESHDWFSASEGDTTSGGDYGFGVRFPYNKAHSSHSHQLMVFEYENSAFKLRLISDQKFRDLSQFYHLVVAVDTTIASPSSDRVKVYVNGERITAWKSGAEQYPSQNLELTVSESGKTSQIGCSVDESGVVQPVDGFASNFYLIDGQQLGPEEFGFTDPLTNTWRPKEYEGDFKIIPDNQLLYNVNTADNGFDSGTSSRTYDATGRTFTTYTTPQTANPGGFGANSAHVYKSPDGAAINWIISTDSTDRYVWTSTDGINWTNTGVQDTDGSVVTVNTAWLAIAGGSNSTNATVTSSTAGYGSIVGHNSFYLPMDGNTPIGKDQSGNGNDFTPKRFGGSVDLPKATGAIPILNTNEAGTVAKGVRTDSKTYTVTASGGNYYLDGALKPTLNAYRGGTYTFDYTGATSHPLYLSSLPDGRHDSSSYSVALDGNGDYLSIPASADFELTGEFTLEYFLYLNSSSGETPTVSWGNGAYKTIFTGSGDTWKLEYPSTSLSLGGDVSTNVGNWKHYALSRDSNNVVRWFIDGKLISTNTVSATIGANDTFTPGFKSNSSNYLNGYISNLRLVKGQALYTSSFTPPSSTLTTTSQGATASNVKLLCCRAEQATTATVSPGTITAAGDAQTTQVHQPFLYNANGVNGVNTGTSNTTKITIPHWAADTLYYYCHNHSGMGSSINVTTDIFKADPYAWKCTLALPCLGNANDVSHLINCNATELPIVPQGNAHADFGTGNFYGGSYDLDGTGDYINVNSSSPYSHVNFGYSDYTAECWVYLDGTGDEYVFNMSTNNGGAAPHWNINFYSTNLIRAGRTDSSGNSRHQITYDFPRNKWMHIAISRGGVTSKLFLDGVLIDSRFDDDGIAPTGNLNIGAYSNGGNELNGFVQDARIYNGVAKYTESFVVGSTAPDVLPDSPSGITGKTNLTKITDGAVAFDGSSDFLQVPASEDLNVGNANFTAEAWVYPTQYGEIIGAFNLNSPYNGWLWSLTFDNAGGKQMIWFDGNQQKSTTVVPLNKWSHIAFSKSGTTVKYFLDGKLDGSFTASADSTWSNQAVNIGADSNSLTSPGRTFGGFISNLRLIKGTALYTSDFTPPTEPLTAVTNTKLLCCQSNTSAVVAAVGPGTFVNDGTNYSSGNQVTGSSGLVYVDSLFDGHLKSSGASAGEGATVSLSSDNYILWTPTTGIPYTSKVEVFCYAANGYDITNYYTFNGGTETSFVGGAANYNGHSWITVATGSGTINSIKIRLTRSSGQSHVGWYAVRVDGTILLNDQNGKSIARFDDASATNFNPFTDDINAIRGQESGYCTMNPLDQKFTDNGTISNGNLDYAQATTGARGARCTIGASSGKFYWEFTHLGGNASHGIQKSSSSLGSYPGGSDADGISWFVGGNIYRNGSTSAYAGKTYAVGDCIGTALDLDNGTLVFYKNGLSQGVAASGLTGTWFPSFGSSNVSVVSFTSNFGQKPFKFPPPDGFQPLNLSNVQPDKVIARPDQYVDVSLWSGNGTSQNITGLKHKPDFVWIKKRAGGTARSHQLFDSVRGVYKTLHSDSANQEDSNTNRLTAFNQDGFAVGGDDGCNGSGGTFVGWTWKAGGNKNTFNIDDVGYANASDVNMNVGALNSVTFDKSQNWTSQITGTENSSYPFSNMFNADGQATHAYPANGTRATFTPSPSFSNAKTVKVWYYAPTINSDTFQLNGVNVGDQMTTTGGTLTKTFNVDGFTSWSWSKGVGGDDSGMLRIDVDGVQLVDSGVSTPNVPSISPTGCSFGTKQGFGIIKYSVTASSGYDTVAHGLTQAPEFGIFKCTSENSSSWGVYYTVNGNNANWMSLNSNNAEGGGTDFVKFYDKYVQIAYNSFAGQGNAGVGYMWHSVPGLQKFGIYTGNSSQNFVQLGFRPAIVWVKRLAPNSSSDTSTNNSAWTIMDSTRLSYNGLTPNHLYANWPAEEGKRGDGSGTSGLTDMTLEPVSNGFYLNGPATETNSNTGTFLYCAWAEAPTVNLYGAQANAR